MTSFTYSPELTLRERAATAARLTRRVQTEQLRVAVQNWVPKILHSPAEDIRDLQAVPDRATWTIDGINFKGHWQAGKARELLVQVQKSSPNGAWASVASLTQLAHALDL